MTSEEQLDLWVAGKPTHRYNVSYEIVDENGEVIGHRTDPDGECCPDFSCCSPELLAPLDMRLRFKAASRKQRESMLADFLGNLFKNEGVPNVRTQY